MGRDKTAAGLAGGPAVQAGDWWAQSLLGSTSQAVRSAAALAMQVQNPERARFWAGKALAEDLAKELAKRPARQRKREIRELEAALGRVPGAKSYGVPGRVVSFTGVEHRSDAPMSRGDRARIVKSGWLVNGVQVVKALVEPVVEPVEG